MTSSASPSAPFRVAALYRFARIGDREAVRTRLEQLCAPDVRGILLVAHEGLNGTIAGPPEAVDRVLDGIRALPGFADLDVKFAVAAEAPFRRMKVRIKAEIVTMGEPDLDPATGAGTYVSAADWNALIADPDTIVIDTRNDYETAIGVFRGAVDPKTKTFREFPDWVRNNPGLHNKPKVAMYCTGGIRCEKATAFMKEQGFEEVYHLKGGILKYLEEVPQEESLWDGACFVFDERVSVEHGLKQGEHKLCHACRNPITAEEVTSPYYEEGVSCSNCYHSRSEEDRLRYRQRQHQIALAKKRGQKHIGT